jgi:hypothetical protein
MESYNTNDEQLSHCPLKLITMITTTMTTMRFHGSLVLYLLALLLPAVVSEILPFSLLMEPAVRWMLLERCLLLDKNLHGSRPLFSVTVYFLTFWRLLTYTVGVHSLRRRLPCRSRVY